MRRALLVLCVWSLMAGSALAQKPLGICGELPDFSDRPTWAGFATITDLSPWRFGEAALLSRRTGFRWVLGIFAVRPPMDIAAHVQTIRAQADAAGLTPFLVATMFGEEWYEEVRAGHVATGFPPYSVAAIDTARAYLGRQHAALKAAFPAQPVVWLTTFVNPTLDYGVPWYAPVPDGVDLIALDAYVPQGATFALVDQILAQAVRTTTQPLVLVPQWFQAPGDAQWGQGPSAETLAGYARWVRDEPRIVAVWGFTWNSRPGLVGLKDLPQRLLIEQSLGVVP